MKRLLLILAGALALAGCKGQGGKGQGDGAVEVLPGSVSDAMIPYDTLRSQPPRASDPVRHGGSDREADGAAMGEPQAAASGVVAPGAVTVPAVPTPPSAAP